MLLGDPLDGITVTENGKSVYFSADLIRIVIHEANDSVMVIGMLFENAAKIGAAVTRAEY